MAVRLIYPVSAELGARLSNALLSNVLKRSLNYLLNGLNQSLRTYKRAQVRQVHADNSTERLRSREPLAFKTVHIFNAPLLRLF